MNEHRGRQDQKMAFALRPSDFCGDAMRAGQAGGAILMILPKACLCRADHWRHPTASSPDGPEDARPRNRPPSGTSYQQPAASLWNHGRMPRHPRLTKSYKDGDILTSTSPVIVDGWFGDYLDVMYVAGKLFAADQQRLINITHDRTDARQ